MLGNKPTAITKVLSRTILLFIIVGFITVEVAAADLPHIKIRIRGKETSNIYLDILEFLVKSSHGSTSINYVPLKVSQAREFSLVQNGNLDMGHAGTSPSLEKDFIPVRYPLLRGLSGYRLIFINKKLAPAFKKIQRKEELAKYQGIQGVGWVDTLILRAGGLPHDETNWPNIYPMIEAGRSVYHCFGVLDIFRKYDQHNMKDSNITIAENLAVYYPLYTYFYVNKDRPDIAARIQLLFERCYADGSFVTFFNNHPYVKGSIQRARMDQRTIIRIPNSLMTAESKKVPKALLDENLLEKKDAKTHTPDN